jgi:DNA-binding XRE family transcriptional regulator
MANFASMLKDEISRIARKESRNLVEPLRKQLAVQRTAIAALKRERAELTRELASLSRRVGRAGSVEPSPGADAQQMRFSAAGLRSLRARLGLSAEELGRLAGVSGQSVYNWEGEKARPRQAQIQAIAALRGIGKREARAQLEAQAPSAPAAGPRRSKKAARATD